MVHRLVSLTLLMTFAGSTFGLPLPMSSRSTCDRSLGCQCSPAERQAGTCCCAAKSPSVTRSCCQKKAVAPCCARRQAEQEEREKLPHVSSHCGCGEEYPGLLTTAHEPRLIAGDLRVSPPLSKEMAAIPDSSMLRPMTLGPDDPVPRSLVG
ncbi:MAG: hypothetical protein KDA86_20890 [Planctomycetaceae bacterium]|nr:hypothetical protein [Planctomycetaceae bacterium]